MLVAAVSLMVVPGGCRTDTSSHARIKASERTQGLFGGNDNVAAILESTNVNVYRVALDVDEEDVRQFGETIDEYQIKGKGVRLTADQIRSLNQLLFDDESYGWDNGKFCDFNPGVRIQFDSMQPALQIWLCFECNQLVVIRGETYEGMDFDPMRPQLLAIVKQLFPADTDVQNLPEILRLTSSVRSRKANQRRWGGEVMQAFYQSQVAF